MTRDRVRECQCDRLLTVSGASAHSNVLIRRAEGSYRRWHTGCSIPLQMKLTFRRREVKDLSQLQTLVTEHAEAIESGFRVLAGTVNFGRSTVELVGLDGRGTPALVALGLTGDDAMLFRIVEAYAWSLEYPESVRRLMPAEGGADGWPPRAGGHRGHAAAALAGGPQAAEGEAAGRALTWAGRVSGARRGVGRADRRRPGHGGALEGRVAAGDPDRRRRSRPPARRQSRVAEVHREACRRGCPRCHPDREDRPPCAREAADGLALGALPQWGGGATRRGERALGGGAERARGPQTAPASRRRHAPTEWRARTAMAEVLREAREPRREDRRAARVPASRVPDVHDLRLPRAPGERAGPPAPGQPGQGRLPRDDHARVLRRPRRLGAPDGPREDGALPSDAAGGPGWCAGDAEQARVPEALASVPPGERPLGRNPDDGRPLSIETHRAVLRVLAHQEVHGRRAHRPFRQEVGAALDDHPAEPRPVLVVAVHHERDLRVLLDVAHPPEGAGGDALGLRVDRREAGVPVEGVANRDHERPPGAVRRPEPRDTALTEELGGPRREVQAHRMSLAY